MTSRKTRMIVALDVPSMADAKDLVAKLGDEVLWYKVGFQLFSEEGPNAVRYLKNAGKKVFLDLKFHDIPNTVANAVKACAALGADMINVHASGGSEMARAAVAAARQSGKSPLLIAVTVLTSMDEPALKEVLARPNDASCPPAEHVRYLASLASRAGLDGVVASAHEIEIVRETCGENFILVVPGIRPAGAAAGDQKRVMTPHEAALAGADYIVVGRPVCAAADPLAAAKAVNRELAEAAG